jgi:hypothetical protein
MRIAHYTFIFSSIVIGWICCPTNAMAYPEFQFSSGATRCQECHESPSGGGLLNDYGRDESASTISDGGDGRFMHGAIELPSWINIGGDLRMAGLAKKARNANEFAAFPMQTDLTIRLRASSFAVVATGGATASIRKGVPFSEKLVSREHYVMWRSADDASYVRAGRMFPVFGLRLPDHSTYTRRYLGLHSLEESYLLAAGTNRGSWELHGAVLTPLTAPPAVGSHGWGATLYAEHGNAAGDQGIALQTKWSKLDSGVVGWSGAVYKRWLPDSKLLFAGEANLGTLRARSGQLAIGLASYLSVAWRPATRWGGKLAAQSYDGDLRLPGSRFAVDASVMSFPRAHFEANLLLRAETVSLGQANNYLGLFQLHYYL